MQSDDLGLVARLKSTPEKHEERMQQWDAARKLVRNGNSGSIPRDIVESVISGLEEDADEAAAAIERLVAAPEKLREVLRQILRCEYDGHGLNDCIDNDGVPYQSAFLANCIAEAENLVSESARQALKDAP